MLDLTFRLMIRHANRCLRAGQAVGRDGERGRRRINRDQ